MLICDTHMIMHAILPRVMNGHACFIACTIMHGIPPASVIHLQGAGIGNLMHESHGMDGFVRLRLRVVR